MTNVLVLGAGGQIAKHVVQALRSHRCIYPTLFLREAVSSPASTPRRCRSSMAMPAAESCSWRAITQSLYFLRRTHSKTANAAVRAISNATCRAISPLIDHMEIIPLKTSRSFFRPLTW